MDGSTKLQQTQLQHGQGTVRLSNDCLGHLNQLGGKVLSSPIALCECNIIRRGSGSNLSAYPKQKKTYHNATKVGQQQVKLGSPSELDSNIRDSNMIVLDWKKELKKWMDCCVYHSIQRQKYQDRAVSITTVTPPAICRNEQANRIYTARGLYRARNCDRTLWDHVGNILLPPQRGTWMLMSVTYVSNHVHSTRSIRAKPIQHHTRALYHLRYETMSERSN